MHAQASLAPPGRPCRSTTELVAWAWQQMLPAIPKLVLLAMASETYPNEQQMLEAITMRCSLDLQSASDMVVWLFNRGYVVADETGSYVAGAPA